MRLNIYSREVADLPDLVVQLIQLPQVFMLNFYLLGIVNKGFSGTGERLPSGTIAPAVERMSRSNP